MEDTPPSQTLRSKKWNLTLTLLILTVFAQVSTAFVTYTFVSLPDNSIALDQNGSLAVLLVLLKIFVLGVTGQLPLNLNELLKKRRERRDYEHKHMFIKVSTLIMWLHICSLPYICLCVYFLVKIWFWILLELWYSYLSLRWWINGIERHIPFTEKYEDQWEEAFSVSETCEILNKNGPYACTISF